MKETAGPGRRWATQRRLGLVAVAVWIPIATYLSLTDRLPWAVRHGPLGAVGHVGLGLALTATGLYVLHLLRPGPRRPILASAAVVGGVLAFLTAMEALQASTMTRTPDAADLAADLAGAVIGIAVVAAVGLSARAAPLRTGIALPALAIAAAGISLAAALALPVGEEPPLGPIDPAPDCIGRFGTAEDGSLAAASSDDRTPAGRADRGSELLSVDFTDGRTDTGDSVELERVGVTVPAGPEGLRFDGPTAAVRSTGPVSGLIGALAERQSFTLNVRFTLDDPDQYGPARLVAISSGIQLTDLDLQLGVQGGRLILRIRSACDPSNWMELFDLHAGSTHVAVTYDAGALAFYADGELRAEAELVGADLGSWDPSYPLTIGNETTLDRPLDATIACLAIADQALDRTDAEALTAGERCSG